jgi:hypothetical protein
LGLVDLPSRPSRLLEHDVLVDIPHGQPAADGGQLEGGVEVVGVDGFPFGRGARRASTSRM